jgi:hypothetical protein
MAKKAESKTVPPTGTSPRGTASKAATDLPRLLRRVGGFPIAGSERLALKMTPAEQERFVQSVETGKDPRGVLQSIRDRITDDAKKPAAESKPVEAPPPQEDDN